MRTLTIVAVTVLTFSLAGAVLAQENDPIETAGVGVGITAGNAFFVPMKAISVVLGAGIGGLSFILSGGNAELTRQIWQDTTQGPYLITPELARQGVGSRPELEKR
jgi:hypothetical protein